MPFAPINGIDFYYEEHGSGPPVVFAHGAGGNHAIWYQQVPFFARSWRTITFDHRGFGHSDDTNGLGRGSFVDDLLGLLDHLGISKASLVVQSMGGLSGMGMAVQHPERVSALVMADTLAGITLDGDLGERQRRNAEATRDLPQLDRVVSKSLPYRDPAKAELYLQVASFNKDNATRLQPNPGAKALEPLTLDQVKTAARSVPMLFLVGAEDILQPPDIVRAASRMVPNARYACVPDAGHSVYFEQPAVFNFEVERFLLSALHLAP
jgi:pimeloyl-ACP methyl ester carboxylesterase